MKFTCERQALLDALAVASRAISSRPEAAILGSLNLELDGSDLTITGTDMEFWVRSSLKVSDKATSGSVAITARHIIEALRSCEPGTVTVESAGDKTTLVAGRAKFSFNHRDSNDFPKLTLDECVEATVDTELLVEALGQVVSARSTDQARASLTAVQLSQISGGEEEAEGEGEAEAEGTEASAADDATAGKKAKGGADSEDIQGIRMVCTDSYRLALRDLKDLELDQVKSDLLIPGRALEELSRLGNKADKMIMGLGENQVYFKVGDIMFLSSLLSGHYPKYKSLLEDPDRESNFLRLKDADSREALTKAIQQVRVMGNADTPIRLHLLPNSLKLVTVSDIGESQVEVDVEYSGPELTIAFNPKFLLDGVEACPGDDLKIYAIDELKPAVLRGSPEEDFLYLLMPVRVT